MKNNKDHTTDSFQQHCLTPSYFPIPWSIVLLQKLNVSHLVKKFPTFYGTKRFISTFTSARYLSLF